VQGLIWRVKVYRFRAQGSGFGGSRVYPTQGPRRRAPYPAGAHHHWDLCCCSRSWPWVALRLHAGSGHVADHPCWDCWDHQSRPACPTDCCCPDIAAGFGRNYRRSHNRRLGLLGRRGRQDRRGVGRIRTLASCGGGHAGGAVPGHEGLRTSPPPV
jgi:hypothetical protein